MQAKAIIEELATLTKHDSAATMGRMLSAINKKWRALGNLEQSERRKLQKMYQTAQKPIQMRLNAFYSDNLERKQVLLKKAEQLEAVEDVSSAAESAKQFQQQWKEIGFSGKQTDDELWVAFRKANDAVFAKISEKRDAEASALSQAKTDFHAQAEVLSEQLKTANELKDLSNFEADAEVLNEQLRDIPTRQAKTEQQKLDSILQQYKARQREFEQQKNAAQWTNLFETLAAWTDDSLPQSAAELPNKFQQLMKSAVNEKSADRRKKLTIQSEIIADLPSNKADEKERKLLQLQLMAARLEGSDVPTVDGLLADWISCGPLLTADHALLKRLKKVILA